MIPIVIPPIIPPIMFHSHHIIRPWTIIDSLLLLHGIMPIILGLCLVLLSFIEDKDPLFNRDVIDSCVTIVGIIYTMSIIAIFLFHQNLRNLVGLLIFFGWIFPVALVWAVIGNKYYLYKKKQNKKE